MVGFKDSTELLNFAEKLLRTRVESLERDATNCLGTRPPAPFPALLYGFSTIDLLGAALAGDAKRHRPSVTQAKNYMTTFMGYTDDQATLLQDIFRHKLVHLAVPKAVLEDKGRSIVWYLMNVPDGYHLKLLPRKLQIAVTPGWIIDADHEFHTSIPNFVADIRESVFRSPGGYLDALRGNTAVQSRFQQAMLDMFDPRQ